MHFLPGDPPKVFFDDTENIYFTDSAQTEAFKEQWSGEIAVQETENGYRIEVGFAIPNFYAQAGQKMGVEIAVCDDDGEGRKSLMTWSGYQGPFWITMDNFKHVVLE